MAEKKKMSVAEVLAAARAADGKAGSPPAAAGAEPPAAAPAQEKPAAAKPAAPAASGARPSVAEIMAMARANKEAAGAAEPKPVAAEKPAAAAKPAAKAAAAKAADPAAAGRKGVERDTASILAAARAAAKPGPVSKAEAPPRPAAKPKPAAEKVVATRPVPPKPTRPPQPVKKAVEAEDRRGFLEIATGSFMAMGFTALSITGGLFTAGLARYFFPNVLAEPPSKFKVGFKEGFPAGKVETKYVAQYGVWVVNGEFQGEQQIYALKTVCTHLGCTPSWLEAEQKFKCPCHGSGFYKDGVNFEGPAPRPLERYAIRIADDGQLEVDKSRTFQEELGQWADASSFVTV